MLLTLVNDLGVCYVNPDEIAGIDAPKQAPGRLPYRAIVLKNSTSRLLISNTEANREALVFASVLSPSEETWGEETPAKKEKAASGRGRPRKIKIQETE